MKLRTRRRLYLREAFVAVVLARIALRLIPPVHIFSWVDRPLKRTVRFANEEIDWIAWAIEMTAVKWPMDAPCLPCALAAHAMLRRRGIVSRVCLGVARDDRELVGHAWVEVGSNKIMGDAGGNRFTHIENFGMPKTV